MEPLFGVAPFFLLQRMFFFHCVLRSLSQKEAMHCKVAYINQWWSESGVDVVRWISSILPKGTIAPSCLSDLFKEYSLYYPEDSILMFVVCLLVVFTYVEAVPFAPTNLFGGLSKFSPDKAIEICQVVHTNRRSDFANGFI